MVITDWARMCRRRWAHRGQRWKWRGDHQGYRQLVIERNRTRRCQTEQKNRWASEEEGDSRCLGAHQRRLTDMHGASASANRLIPLLSERKNVSRWRGGRLARGMYGSIAGGSTPQNICTRSLTHSCTTTNSRETRERISGNMRLMASRSGQ
jgi:hypothetical protein